MDTSNLHVNFYMDGVTTTAARQIRGWMEMPLAFLPTGAMPLQAPAVHAPREDGHGYEQTRSDASSAIPGKCTGQASNHATNGQANHGIAFDALVV